MASCFKMLSLACAVAALAQLVGPDLWMLSNEIEKLGAYAGKEEVTQEMVEDLVSAAREARIWDLTDAVVAGDSRKALATLSRLLTEGQPAPMLAFMIVRQYRQIALVKDLRERRVRQDEVARAAGWLPGRTWTDTREQFSVHEFVWPNPVRDHA